MDVMPPADRSRNMAAIRGADTKPELTVRRALHARGFRYRLHARDLAGRPDLVLPRRRAVIFIHGCFWHRHPDCRFATTPATRTAFWEAKFDANVARDKRNLMNLFAADWRVATVWECQLRGEGFKETLEHLCHWLLSDDRSFELPPPQPARGRASCHAD